MSNTLPVRAVRSRTFLTPDGRYTVELTRPRRIRTDSWAVVDWAVLVTNPDKTRVTVARGEAEMPRDVALSTVDAMLRVMPDAWLNRVGGWKGDDGYDRLTRLATWAQYRRDARYGAQSAQPGRQYCENGYQWGKHTPARAVRCAREAWARYLGQDPVPDGYTDGAHLRPGKPVAA